MNETVEKYNQFYKAKEEKENSNNNLSETDKAFSN